MEYSEDDLLDIINGVAGSGDETGNDQTDTGGKKPDSPDITSTDSPEGQTTETKSNDDVIEPRNEIENKKTNLLSNLNDKFDDIDRMLDVSFHRLRGPVLHLRILEVFI